MNRYGPWVGRDTLAKEQLNKVSHSLLCSSVVVALLARNAEQLLTAWTSERQIEYEFKRQRFSGAVPDGVLGKQTAVEVLGRYPRDHIASKCEKLEQRFKRLELWGVRL